jgi:hypothetical protein
VPSVTTLRSCHRACVCPTPAASSSPWRRSEPASSYDVDLNAHTCTYYGIDPTTASYVEEYPYVSLDDALSPTNPL